LLIQGVEVSHKELLNDFPKEIEAEIKKDIKTLFEKLDKDNSGYLSAEELVTAFKSSEKRLTLEQAREMIKQTDTNDDGCI